MDVIKRWITDQLVEFLGFEEEVTIGLVINYLESVRAWEHGREERGEGGTERGEESRIGTATSCPPSPPPSLSPSLPPSLPPPLPVPQDTDAKKLQLQCT